MQNRFRKLVERFGETFTVGAASRTAIIAPVSPERAAHYLDTSVLASLGRPVRFGYVAHNDPTAEGASISWNSLTLTVQRAIDFRFAGETVLRLLVLG